MKAEDGCEALVTCPRKAKIRGHAGVNGLATRQNVRKQRLHYNVHLRGKKKSSEKIKRTHLKNERIPDDLKKTRNTDPCWRLEDLFPAALWGQITVIMLAKERRERIEKSDICMNVRSEKSNFVTLLIRSGTKTEWIVENYYVCVCVCVCVTHGKNVLSHKKKHIPE